MMSAQDSESYGDLDGETVKQNTDVSVEVVHRKTPSIQDLPEEVFEMIIELLPESDLYNCSNVCVAWRCILNQDRFWKKHCKYPEKFFKLSSSQVEKRSKSSDPTCKWKKHCMLQRDIWENWKTGRYVTSNIGCSDICKTLEMVDEHGNHWLFNLDTNHCINVRNLTQFPFLHCKHEDSHNQYTDVMPLQDKLVMSNTCDGHVRVYEFKYPEYKLKFSYELFFPSNIRLHFIVVDSRFLICFPMNFQQFVGLYQLFIIIRDLNSSGRHITTVEESEIVKSFVSFIQSKRGFANCYKSRYIFLASGVNGQFLVVLNDKIHNLCQMSLYSITEMKFVKVVAQLEGNIASCRMKGDIVVIRNFMGEARWEISVFNINIGCIGKLGDSTCVSSPLCEVHRFDDDKVIAKVKNCIYILTIVENHKVHKNEFEVCEKLRVVKYFYPRYLMLVENGEPSAILRNRGYDMMSVWDTDTGLKLWDFPPLSPLYLYQGVLHHLDYPGRLLVILAGEQQYSILKFDAPVQ